MSQNLIDKNVKVNNKCVFRNIFLGLLCFSQSIMFAYFLYFYFHLLLTRIAYVQDDGEFISVRNVTVFVYLS